MNHRAELSSLAQVLNHETDSYAQSLTEPDWIYFKRIDGLPIEMHELHVDRFDRNRLLEGAKKILRACEKSNCVTLGRDMPSCAESAAHPSPALSLAGSSPHS